MTTQEQTTFTQKRNRVTDALSSPVDNVVPHPALDVAVDAEPQRGLGLDRLVFGVSAAVAVAFVVWGLVSKATLGTASDKSLAWV